MMFLQVMIDNVGDVFLSHSVVFRH